MPGGRNIGVLGLDDTVALGLGKHLLARYFNAGLAANRPTKGRRAGEAYYATNTHILSVWDGTAWIEGGVGPTGPAGATGPAGHIGIGLDGADGVDGLPLPGPQGVPGTASTVPGPAGATIPGFDGTDGLDAFPVPGLPGLPGVSVMGPPGFDGVDGQEAFPIPGAAGAPGAAGVGTLGPPGMDGEDGLDTGLLGLPSSPLLHPRYTDAEAVAAVEAQAASPLSPYNELYLGAFAARHGILTVAGGGAGNPVGAEFYMGVSASYNGAFSSYFWNVYEDDLYLDQDSAAVIVVKADRSIEIPTGPLKVDHIGEYTATHGIDIDGVLCKDDAVETDAIRGLRETTGPTSLAMGAVADGEYLKRVGTTIVGGTPAGGGGVSDAAFLF